MNKIGIFICTCNTGISDKIDIPELEKSIKSINKDCFIKSYKLWCSKDGIQEMINDIKTNKLTHIVVAACSPKQHEQTFKNVCIESDINPYLFQMVNIREQCAWITNNKKAATEKALVLIKAALKRVELHEPLQKKFIDVNKLFYFLFRYNYFYVLFSLFRKRL